MRIKGMVRKCMFCVSLIATIIYLIALIIAILSYNWSAVRAFLPLLVLFLIATFAWIQ